MKKSELIKIIRTAVRQELNESLPRIVSELLAVSPSKKSIDPVGITKKVLKSENKVIPKKKKRYSNNEALNQVLNETVGGVPQEGSTVMGSEGKMTDFNGQSINVKELPDHVSTALTRNYSDVLKLVDKKRGKTT